MQITSDMNIGVGPIHFERLECLGSETNILQCVHHYDTMTCSHSDDVHIQCQGQRTGAI